MSSDADNFVDRSGSHHVSNGRWLGTRADEFYSATQPRDKTGRWSRLGGRGFTPVGTGSRDAYRATHGISHFPAPKDFSDITVNPSARARAARAYARMPVSDPKAIPAYKALRSEIRQQFDYLTKTLGVKVVVTKTDPYPDVDAMMRDIQENGRLKVMSTATTGSHPFFSNRENDMFRAVHDYFGHAATGRDFSRHGERAAYLSHVSMMKSKDSIRALFTETEMQNAALIATKSFQEQKVALAPDALVFEGLTSAEFAATVSAVFACYSKACAPPPVGKGGSGDSRPSMMTPREILKRFRFGDQQDGETHESIIQMKNATASQGLHDSIRKEGVRDAISVVSNEHGEYIDDGHHRVALASRYHPDKPIKVAYNYEDWKPDFPIITKAEARGDSRPVSHAEFQRLARIGQAQLDKMATDASPTTGLTKNWSALKRETYEEVLKPWGGATIDSHTGKALPQGVDAYAITVKPKGLETVSVREGATAAEFNAAMDKARQQFGPVLERRDHYLGVFHDDDNKRIDIDPVIVVTNRADVDTIGAASRSIGGAYNFADGNGYWPPHVA